MNLLAIPKKKKPVKIAVYKRPSLSMSLTELQMMARSRGIAFGGLSKRALVEVLSKYGPRK